MAKKTKKQNQKPALKRGEQEESKLAKIFTAVGVGVLVTLVLGLIIALIVATVVGKRPAKDTDPLKDHAHIVYSDFNALVATDGGSVISDYANQEEHKDLYTELIKSKVLIIAYYEKEVTDEFKEALNSAKTDKQGIVVINLDKNSALLGADSKTMERFSDFDKKITPFAVVITNEGMTFNLIQGIDLILEEMNK